MLSKPIFTTSDGVALFNGSDEVFDSKGIGCGVVYALDTPGEYYSTREAVPKPLFRTADGVDVFEGDDVYAYWSGSGIISAGRAHKDMKPDAWHSTRESAEAAGDAWLLEQPLLSLRDITGDAFPPEYFETMKAIVKEKLKSK